MSNRVLLKAWPDAASGATKMDAGVSKLSSLAFRSESGVQLECHVNGDLLLTYDVAGEHIAFVRLGTHAVLFKWRNGSVVSSRAGAPCAPL